MYFLHVEKNTFFDWQNTNKVKVVTSIFYEMIPRMVDCIGWLTMGLNEYFWIFHCTLITNSCFSTQELTKISY